MKVKITEGWSGFRNVPNGLALTANLEGLQRDPIERALDTVYTVELPDGYTVGENLCGSKRIYRGDEAVDLVSINHSKRTITGMTKDGPVIFKIVK